jgi:DNA polymerase-2
MDMVKALSSASNCEEFVRAIPKARQVLDDYIAKVREGNVDFEDLVICRNLSRSPSEYSVVTRQAAAAEQLKSFGVKLQAGQRTKFVVLNSGARNPFRRVIAADLSKHDSRVYYDKEEYVKLLQRAFDNLFPPNVRRANIEANVIRPLARTR